MARGKRIFFTRLFSLVLCLSFAGIAHAANEAGIVIEITPGAFVNRGGKKMPLELKAPVYSGDTLITDATGRLRVFMEDDTALSFGADTSFTLENYNTEGRSPEFKGHMAHGLLRALTGRITEANPKGFVVTTPEATIGIRGTIITMRSADGRSTVFVENTMRQVMVNGVNVPSEHRITIAPGLPQNIVPIGPADRRQIGQDLANAGQPAVAAAAPEPGVARAGASFETLNVPNIPAGIEETALAGLPINDLAAPPPAPPMAAVVSGTLSYSDGFSGIFSFDVNLQSGSITNGIMSGAGGTSMVSASLNNGSGNMTASGFRVSDFAGTASISAYTGPAPTSYMSGTVNLRTVPNGGAVPVTARIEAAPPNTGLGEFLVATGTLTK